MIDCDAMPSPVSSNSSSHMNTHIPKSSTSPWDHRQNCPLSPLQLLSLIVPNSVLPQMHHMPLQDHPLLHIPLSSVATSSTAPYSLSYMPIVNLSFLLVMPSIIYRLRIVTQSGRRESRYPSPQILLNFFTNEPKFMYKT